MLWIFLFLQWNKKTKYQSTIIHAHCLMYVFVFIFLSLFSEIREEKGVAEEQAQGRERQKTQ